MLYKTSSPCMLPATCPYIGCMWTLPTTICCPSRHRSNKKSTGKRGFGKERSTKTTGHPRFGSIASTWSARSQDSTGMCVFYFTNRCLREHFKKKKLKKSKTTFFLFIFRCMTYLSLNIIWELIFLFITTFFAIVIQLNFFLMISDSSTWLPVNFMFALCDWSRNKFYSKFFKSSFSSSKNYNK